MIGIIKEAISVTDETLNTPENSEAEVAEKLQQISLRRRKAKKEDPVVIGLMFGASFLCLCIIGVMIYWLTAFLT